MLTLVTVYCNMECIYAQEGKCSATAINIDSDGRCIEYEKEELKEEEK